MRHSHSHSNVDKSQLIGVSALAAGVGALSALLFAKRNGAETRQAIRDKAKQFKTNVKTSGVDIDEAVVNAQDMAAKAKADAMKSIDTELPKK